MPVTTITRAEAEERARLLRVQDYAVALDLGGDPSTFRSETTIRFTADTPGAATFVDLVAPKLERAELNGRPLDLSLFDGARLRLPSLEAENALTVVARCEYSHTGEGLHRFADPVDGETYLYTQFEVADARRVFAVFDQPDLKASFQFAVTGPDPPRTTKFAVFQGAGRVPNGGSRDATRGYDGGAISPGACPRMAQAAQARSTRASSGPSSGPPVRKPGGI